eukprot:8854267-Karenia_brevis.AAC.1
MKFVISRSCCGRECIPSRVNFNKTRYSKSKQKLAKATHDKKLGYMFRKLKPFTPPPVAMRDGNGKLTCNPKEILACVVDAWSPIYHRFSQEPPPRFA